MLERLRSGKVIVRTSQIGFWARCGIVDVVPEDGVGLVGIRTGDIEATVCCPPV